MCSDLSVLAARSPIESVLGLKPTSTSERNLSHAERSIQQTGIWSQRAALNTNVVHNSSCNS